MFPSECLFSDTGKYGKLQEKETVSLRQKGFRLRKETVYETKRYDKSNHRGHFGRRFYYETLC